MTEQEQEQEIQIFKLDRKEIACLCRAILVDVNRGDIDSETMRSAKSIVRHIANWQEQTQTEVTVSHVEPIA